MTGCPVCESYGARNGDIDRAGRDYHEAMVRIREREAAGLPVEQRTGIPPALVRAAERTDLAMGFSEP